jgi:hypothetical protein
MDEPSPARIPLNHGQVAVVDAADLPRASAHRWRAEWCALPRRRGIWRVSTGRRPRIDLNRFLLDADPDEVISHVNGDGLDNRRANLRRWRKAKWRPPTPDSVVDLDVERPDRE